MQLTGFAPAPSLPSTPPPTAAVTPTRSPSVSPTQTRHAIRGASALDRAAEGDVFQPKDPDQGAPLPDAAAKRGWLLDMLA